MRERSASAHLTGRPEARALGVQKDARPDESRAGGIDLSPPVAEGPQSKVSWYVCMAMSQTSRESQQCQPRDSVADLERCYTSSKSYRLLVPEEFTVSTNEMNDMAALCRVVGCHGLGGD